MLHLSPPENFSPAMNVVGCFVEHDGMFLLLHRSSSKPQGGTWGSPSGKVHKDESLDDAIAREVLEETSLNIPPSQFKHFATTYVRYAEYDFTYHIFSIKRNERPSVIIDSKSHQDYAWVTPRHALSMPLIEDLGTCIEMFYPNLYHAFLEPNLNRH